MPYGAQVQVQVTVADSTCDAGITVTALPAGGPPVNVATFQGAKGRSEYALDFTASGGPFAVGEGALTITRGDCGFGPSAAYGTRWAAPFRGT